MTKGIRVENADNADYGVIVEVWDKGVNGKPDTLAETIELTYPCDMTDPRHCYITDSRYLVVKEKEPASVMQG